MTTMFDDRNILLVTDLLPFLDAAEVFNIVASCSLEDRADWIKERLERFRYRALKRKEKGILLRYLLRMTGCCKRTMQYHIDAYIRHQKICAPYKRHHFSTRFTNNDRELLAETDNLHNRLNAAATKQICMAMAEAGDDRYERLATVSVSHIYNLRTTRSYVQNALTVEKTKSVNVPIGIRRKPEPNGEPGFIRVDTVHQGDKDGRKGVYHINLVDEVTQWELMIAVPQISERGMKEALEAVIPLFPFFIQNYHSDNGSENINFTVASLLTRMTITQSKGRPRHSNDNGLVETKNGAIIRKHMGHWHINGTYAPRINAFYRDHLIPYVNYYRPCGFPKREVQSNGKVKITYPSQNYQTPLQRLLSIQDVERFLRPGITRSMLLESARKQAPNEAAEKMQKAKKRLLEVIIELPSGIMNVNHPQVRSRSVQSSN